MDKADHTPVRGVRVPDDLWNAAQEKARARGDSVSQYLRDKLREYVDRDEKSGAFWEDLAADMRDPEFVREYEVISEAIRKYIKED